MTPEEAYRKVWTCLEIGAEPTLQMHRWQRTREYACAVMRATLDSYNRGSVIARGLVHNRPMYVEDEFSLTYERIRLQYSPWCDLRLKRCTLCGSKLFAKRADGDREIDQEIDHLTMHHGHSRVTIQTPGEGAYDHYMYLSHFWCIKGHYQIDILKNLLVYYGPGAYCVDRDLSARSVNPDNHPRIFPKT